ncbi:MAG: metal ABC transporter permease [Chlamydiales bacterium]
MISWSGLLNQFVDPVLRAPTIASMVMCAASALIGVVAFLRKRCLLAETLSHASYPGIVLGLLILATFFSFGEEVASIIALVGAFLSALGGLFLVELMEKKLKVKGDAALCFALALFFGIGILFASHLQSAHPIWFNKVHLFLYGQVATMTDQHIFVYGALFILTVLFLVFLYQPLKLINFDRQFAQSVGSKVVLIDSLLFLLLVLAIIIGLRSVGVVLMSGMLVAPAVAARQFTHRLSLLFILAGAFGLFSGFCGCYLSSELPKLWDEKVSLPTGPMILLTASSICFIALLFAPTRGLLSRLVRIARFKDHCRQENALKALWRAKESAHPLPHLSPVLLYRLVFKRLAKKEQHGFELTERGVVKAKQIIRLHRLWEVYLVSLGQGAEKVHHSAEEMEHIITPEMERALTEFLEDPTHDPHQQPIPAPL